MIPAKRQKTQIKSETSDVNNIQINYFPNYLRYNGSINRINIPVQIINSNKSNLNEIMFIRNIIEDLFNSEDIELGFILDNFFNFRLKINKQSDIPKNILEQNNSYETTIFTTKFNNLDKSKFDLLSINIEIFKFSINDELKKCSGLFGIPGVYPNITVNKKTGTNNFEFLVSFSKEGGNLINFQKFIKMFTLFLKNENTNNIFTTITSTNNIEGYKELGSEQYDGSLILSTRKLINLILQTDNYCSFIRNDSLYIAQCRNIDLEIMKQIAIACSQYTTPIAGNCSIFACKKLDEELQKQRLGEIKDNGIFPEGLQFVFNLINSEICDIDKKISNEFAENIYKQKQWYSFWILYRLLLEAKRRKIGENVVKCDLHETDDDFQKYNQKIIFLFEKVIDKINKIIKETTETVEFLNKYENRWHIYNLCNKLLDIYNFIK